MSAEMPTLNLLPASIGHHLVRFFSNQGLASLCFSQETLHHHLGLLLDCSPLQQAVQLSCTTLQTNKEAPATSWHGGGGRKVADEDRLTSSKGLKGLQPTPQQLSISHHILIPPVLEWCEGQGASCI